MGTIYIDDQPVEFKDGDNVLDAAKNAGIEVPYFCYHPAMGSVGSCRACAMETVPQKEGERPRLVMSCTVKAADGMKFTLNSGKSEQVHKNVIEFNMEKLFNRRVCYGIFGTFPFHNRSLNPKITSLIKTFQKIP